MTPLERLDWLRAVMASPVANPHTKIALALALRINGQTGECYPSKACLCEDTGMSDASVRRGVLALVSAGLLSVTFSNGRLANRYRLLMASPNPVTSEGVEATNPVTHDPVTPPNPVIHEGVNPSIHEGVKTPTPSPMTGNPSTHDARNKGINRKKDLRVAKATVEPAFGGPDLPQVSIPATKQPKADFKPAGATLPVRAVFQYWQQVMDHQGAILDNKRSKAIAARLKEGHSVERLKQAIDGCKASAWHQGKNNRQTIYDDIELICRDAKHVEEFITRVTGKSTQQRELDAWINHDNFIEGECRHVQA